MIEDSFREKKHTVAVWIDMEKAFDKVWTDGLINKLTNIKISHRMLKWIKSYLDDRQALVKANEFKSKTEDLTNGVPQGGVLSPTLFLIFINDIQKQMTKNVFPSLYADDLALICSEEELGTAKVRLQATLNNITKWTAEWGLSVNKSKTTYTVFTLSTKKSEVKLEINGHHLQKNDSPTYLGVTFDPRLTWKKQTEDCLKKGMQRTALIKKLAGSQWGANHSILKKTYQGYVRPILEYGISSWGHSAQTNLQRVKKIHNQNLRIMTGGMKSTPILEMETSGQQSIEERRDSKVLILEEKIKRLPKHPMNKRLQAPTKTRLKRESFVHSSKTLRKSLNIPIDSDPQQIEIANPFPLWSRKGMTEIVDNLKSIKTKTTMTQEEISQKANSEIEQLYPKTRVGKTIHRWISN